MPVVSEKKPPLKPFLRPYVLFLISWCVTCMIFGALYILCTGQSFSESIFYLSFYRRISTILHDSTAVLCKKIVKYFDKMVYKRGFLKIVNLYLSNAGG